MIIHKYKDLFWRLAFCLYTRWKNITVRNIKRKTIKNYLSGLQNLQNYIRHSKSQKKIDFWFQVSSMPTIHIIIWFAEYLKSFNNIWEKGVKHKKFDSSFQSVKSKIRVNIFFIFFAVFYVLHKYGVKLSIRTLCIFWCFFANFRCLHH